MAVREQPGQGLPDEVALADDDPADLALDGLGAFRECLGGKPLGRIDGGWRFHEASESAADAGSTTSVRRIE